MYKLKAADGKNNICGKNLKEYRLKNKLSQRKLSDKLQLLGVDIDRHMIRRIESGERFVTDIEIVAFCNALSISYGKFIDGSDINKK